MSETPTNELVRDGMRMVAAGVPFAFALRVVEMARTGRGVRALLTMWCEAVDEVERDEIVADLAELIDDSEGPRAPLGASTLGDVEREAHQRGRWKGKLRKLVESGGGVSDVARRAGIPQPSLSRMLNDLSEPRPATLAKLAEALGVPVGALRDGEEAPRRPPAMVVPLGPYRAPQVITPTSFRIGRHEARA